MTRTAARDDGLIEAIATRYGAAISAYFSRRISDRAEVEDMTQEVFASLVRRAELGAIDNIEGYIFRIPSVATCQVGSPTRRVFNAECITAPLQLINQAMSSAAGRMGRWEIYSRLRDPERPVELFHMADIEEHPENNSQKTPAGPERPAPRRRLVRLLVEWPSRSVPGPRSATSRPALAARGTASGDART